MSRTALIAGNWKMNGLTDALGWGEVLKKTVAESPSCEVALCPPATLIHPLSDRLPDWVSLGGQDCSPHESGAHTGDVAAAMLADLGCRWVIVGHSERRAGHHETDQMVKAKAEAALNAGLTVILCVGETLAERETGQAEHIVLGQLAAGLPEGATAQTLVIAYEPVWAIGSGRTATPRDAAAMHAAIRMAWPGDDAQALRIVYGGSVKPDTAAELLGEAEIDGALVGGASLDPEAFAAIIGASR